MSAKLYALELSHPSEAVRLMLERKGIEYKRRDLMPVIARGMLRAMRFPGVTVPALRIDGQRIQGSTTISRALDRLRPEPPLFPGDPERRAAVEEAERWGDEVLQGLTRRILWNGIKRDHSAIGSYAEGARLGIPISVATRTSAPIIAAEVRLNRAGDENVRTDLGRLPGALDRIDDWIADGVLGGENLNAADLQLATCVRLLMTIDDVRPAIEERPAGEHALTTVPEFPGRVPAVFPADWLEPLRAAETAPSST